MNLFFLQLLAFSCASVDAFQSNGVSSRCSTVLNAGGTTMGKTTVNRRIAIQSTIASALSFLLCNEPVSAEASKTILITGANSGIGFEAAKKLAGNGHKIILACRSLEKADDAIERIKAETGAGTLVAAECDLASLRSIRKFAGSVGNDIDVLCLNAGLSMNTDDTEIKRTEDGFEKTVGINHLGHFLLSDLLLPKINKQNGRIVVTASGGKS